MPNVREKSDLLPRLLMQTGQFVWKLSIVEKLK